MNFATYVEPIAVRDDDEPVPDFKVRARALLAERGGGCIAWGAPEEVEWVDAEPDAIIVRGGLERDDHEKFATVGDAMIEREDGELIEDFRARARDAARAAGAGFVTFGGLPKMNVSDDECETKGE